MDRDYGAELGARAVEVGVARAGDGEPAMFQLAKATPDCSLGKLPQPAPTGGAPGAAGHCRDPLSHGDPGPAWAACFGCGWNGHRLPKSRKACQ